jgi:ABC-type xylose transport system substrate-binding protein
VKTLAAALLLLVALCAPAGAQSPFTAAGATVSLAVTATTGRVAVTGLDAFNPAVRFFNSGAATVFAACGDVTVVATTASLPIAAGTIEVLGCNKGGYVAGITASGTATLYLTAGSGL